MMPSRLVQMGEHEDEHGRPTPLYDWLRSCLDVLRDRVTSQDAFYLTTRPLLEAISTLHDRQLPSHIWLCEDVELTALFERLLAYAVSGSGKTLGDRATRAYGMMHHINRVIPQVRFEHRALPCPGRRQEPDTLKIELLHLPTSSYDETKLLLAAFASLHHHAGYDFALLYAELIRSTCNIIFLSKGEFQYSLQSNIQDQVESCLTQYTDELRHIVAKILEKKLPSATRYHVLSVTGRFSEDHLHSARVIDDQKQALRQ